VSDVRIDKWLWAARFFKTRQLAIDAIDKGKVKLSGGERIKPSRNVKLGERLHIDNGADEWDVLVVGISGKREGAPIARLLYEESEESLARRAALIERKKMFPEPFAENKGRPTKRDRRQWERATDS
jgi:ribosome-associated heat shock protein Hsp15